MTTEPLFTNRWGVSERITYMETPALRWNAWWLSQVDPNGIRSEEADALAAEIAKREAYFLAAKAELIDEGEVTVTREGERWYARYKGDGLGLPDLPADSEDEAWGVVIYHRRRNPEEVAPEKRHLVERL